MPAGTDPEKVLQAVQLFCREEFALKHRYALVLHTDEPHPHVHVVVKAMGEEGQRLNIRKANLRFWRQEFARHLRAQGVAANATERAVRGAEGLQQADGIYRAWRRGHSTHVTNLVQGVADELDCRAFRTEPGKAQVVATRAAVVEGWNSIGDRLEEVGQTGLAAEVRTFAGRLGAGKTQRERIAEDLPRLIAQRSSARPSAAHDPRVFEIGGR